MWSFVPGRVREYYTKRSKMRALPQSESDPNPSRIHQRAITSLKIMAAIACKCGKLPSDFGTLHGFRTHKGMCKRSAPPQRVEPSRPADEEHEDRQSEGGSIAAMDEDARPDCEPGETRTTTTTTKEDHFGSATDAALAELYCRHPELTKGLLKEIIKITSMEPATIRSADKLFARIDQLPGMIILLVIFLITVVAGIEFQTSATSVDDQSYDIWHRCLLETTALLLGRVAKDIELPQLLPEGQLVTIDALWKGSVYQQHLRNFSAHGGNLDHDLLLPLCFFSGVYAEDILS